MSNNKNYADGNEHTFTFGEFDYHSPALVSGTYRLNPAHTLTSHEYVLGELQWYRSLAEASSMQEFVANVIAQTREMGFSDLSFYRIAEKSLPSLCISTMPPAISESCVESEAYRFDPVFEYAMSNTEPIFQSTISEYLERAPFKTKGLLIVLELHRLIRELGYQDQYCIPIGAAGALGRALFIVTCKHASAALIKERTAEHETDLRLLARAVHYIGITRFPNYFIEKGGRSSIKISPKLLQLLNTLAKDDLTLKEAADKLCMSESTTNKHIAALKQALGVKTLWGAIHSASKSGLLG